MLEVLREGVLVAWLASSLVMVVGKGVPLMVWVVVMVLGVEVVGSEVVEPVVVGSEVVVASWLEDGVDEESVEEVESVVEEDESVVEVGVAEDCVIVGDEVSETDVLDSVADSEVEVSVVSVEEAEALPEGRRLPTSETKALWPAVTVTSDREYRKNENFEIRILGKQ